VTQSPDNTIEQPLACYRSSAGTRDLGPQTPRSVTMTAPLCHATRLIRLRIASRINLQLCSTPVSYFFSVESGLLSVEKTAAWQLRLAIDHVA
jgi:hypothetical protein